MDRCATIPVHPADPQNFALGIGIDISSVNFGNVGCQLHVVPLLIVAGKVPASPAADRRWVSLRRSR